MYQSASTDTAPLQTIYLFAGLDGAFFCVCACCVRDLRTTELRDILPQLLVISCLRGDVNSLISNVEPWPDFVCVVAGRFARAEEPLQLGHAQLRRGAFGVFSVRRPGAAPGPREPGHERHLS